MHKPFEVFAVHRWMFYNSENYETATALAEGAVHDAKLLPDSVLDDETHWIWDEALLAKERESRDEQ